MSGCHPELKAFLESRIADGIRYNTFQREAAALSKEREIAVSIDTYKNIEEMLMEKENMQFDKDDYREALKEAALLSDQDYTGSHGLRWNFAEERMEELQEHTNMTYEERLQEVSWEMGHERADITEHYLRR